MIHPQFLRGLAALILVLIAHFCFLTREKITKTTDNTRDEESAPWPPSARGTGPGI